MNLYETHNVIRATDGAFWRGDYRFVRASTPIKAARKAAKEYVHTYGRREPIVSVSVRLAGTVHVDTAESDNRYEVCTQQEVAQ